MKFQMNISSGSLRFKSLSTPFLKLNERWTYGYNAANSNGNLTRGFNLLHERSVTFVAFFETRAGLYPFLLILHPPPSFVLFSNEMYG